MTTWSNFYLPGSRGYVMPQAQKKHDLIYEKERMMPVRVSCAHCGRGKNARDVYAGREWFQNHTAKCGGGEMSFLWTFLVPVAIICVIALIVKKLLDASAIADQLDQWHKYDLERDRRERREAWDWQEEWSQFVRDLPETKEPVR